MIWWLLIRLWRLLVILLVTLVLLVAGVGIDMSVFALCKDKRVWRDVWVYFNEGKWNVC